MLSLLSCYEQEYGIYVRFGLYSYQTFFFSNGKRPVSLSGRILSRHVINSPRDPSIPLCPGEPATHTLLGETQYASTDFIKNGGYILTDSVTNFLKGIGILLVGFQAAR